MKSFVQPNEPLSYFVGKLCSVMTVPIHTSMFPDREFQQKQNLGYFVGRVDKISQLGVWTTHPATGTKNFFFREHVVGICEEQVIDENHPDFEELNKAYEEKSKSSEAIKTPKGFVPPTVPTPPPTSEGKHIDINMLEEMARKQKERIK